MSKAKFDKQGDTYTLILADGSKRRIVRERDVWEVHGRGPDGAYWFGMDAFTRLTDAKAWVQAQAQRVAA